MIIASNLVFLDDAAKALEEFFGDIPTHAFVVVVRDDIPCVGSRPTIFELPNPEQSGKPPRKSLSPEFCVL